MSSGRETFARSVMHQDAALRNLQTLAESTQRISAGAKARHSGIDWRRIAAFRNVLVHDYLGVDVDVILDIVDRDLPELERVIRLMLDEHRSS